MYNFTAITGIAIHKQPTKGESTHEREQYHEKIAF